ncbi:MAG: EI24 domain-containing protein [SAR324 cluster bacterium]|nr:EI24 domain-containing protein [SAR324 cluster bacterium]MBL7035293.1 EI24 domain-containing protein [SAR324 cluster bacterium]
MNESKALKKVTMIKANALTVFRAGNQALAEIEGLRGMAIRGMLLNYLIFFAVAIVLNGLIYFQLLSPFINWIFGGDTGFWAAVGQVILWSIQLTVAAVIALVSLRFSVELLSLWHQSLVKKVIKHFRRIDEPEFSLNEWLTEIKYIFKEALKSILFPVLLLFVGLLPVIGLPLVFVLESHLMGRSSMHAYLDSLANQEEAAELRRSWRWIPIRIGWLPTILAFIPFIGWLFLPLSITYQVIGFCYLVEKSRED